MILSPGKICPLQLTPNNPITYRKRNWILADIEKYKNLPDRLDTWIQIRRDGGDDLIDAWSDWAGSPARIISSKKSAAPITFGVLQILLVLELFYLFYQGFNGQMIDPKPRRVVAV